MIRLVQAYAAKHADLLPVLARIIMYMVIYVVTHHLGEQWKEPGGGAALFVLFSAAFEMVTVRLDLCARGFRLVCFFACVAAMAATGCILVSEAMHSKASASACSGQRK